MAITAFTRKKNVQWDTANIIYISMRDSYGRRMSGHNTRLREQLYFSMIESGVLPTALYHTLIPEIAVERFPEAHFVSANILNLPTHADISEADLPRYEKALRDAVNEVFSK